MRIKKNNCVMKHYLLQIVLILSTIFLLASCNALSNEYSGKELPQELQFGEKMKEFHKRDFFKEIDDFVKSNKSCKETSCTSQEETELIQPMVKLFMTNVNEMEWMCDYEAGLKIMNEHVKIVNGKGNVDIIKPLIKRMKFCDELHKQFKEHVFNSCLDLLNSQRAICASFKRTDKGTLIRRSKIKKFESIY